MRAAAADQAGNDGLKGGIRGKLLGFRRDLRFFRSSAVKILTSTSVDAEFFIGRLTASERDMVWLLVLPVRPSGVEVLQCCVRFLVVPLLSL
ncbi:hypothetical protein Taro_053003 [Colocasia esculenta]|uniref:Uncharacterized protein n=1 Tax=Colocasia esculenta TaxID=4460 RepID=A0A843XK31_COLES|nr:hypothetical protein [Colocasia esculenta]